MLANAFVHKAPSRRLGLSTYGLPTVWLAVLACALFSACAPAPQQPAESADTTAEATAPQRGGRLVLTMRAELKSFNPLSAFDNPSLEVLAFLNADLMRSDPASQRVLPVLAEKVERSPDGRRYTMRLRDDVFFSDGESLDAEDVLFTFRALLDPSLEAPQYDSLLIDGTPVSITATGPLDLEFELAKGHAGGESLFDGVYIVPSHRLGPLAGQELGQAWSVGTEPSEIVGAGPFRLREHRPGERLVLERNPHYWRRDEAGTQLPYLDEIVIEFTGSPEAEVLRFEAGQSDVIEGLGADAFAALERKNGAFTLQDLGPGLVYEFLFFNLNDNVSDSVRKKQAWFRQPAFRRALSFAIDRQAIVDLAYGGRATPVGGHITPANKLYYDNRVKAPEPSIEKARALLEEAGFAFRGDQLFDGETLVELTLVTNSSNSRRVQTATVIQEDLRRLGVTLHVVPLDFGALLDRVYDSFDYEIGLLGLGRGGLDPNASLNVWLSGGDSHLWRLDGDGPDSPWQERLDELLGQQMTELDEARRRELLSDIQLMIADEAPFLFLVAPNVLVGAREGLGHFAPRAAAETAVWNAEHLFWRDPG